MVEEIKKEKEIGLDEMKSLQIEILKAIDSFCEEKGITYSLACGTLLGAIRHKGYIPWDDDLDIYLLREDYNNLMREFPSCYSGHYKLVSLERDKQWDIPFAKAYDDRTVMEELIDIPVKIGVNIDVYPVDDVPDDETAWLIYNKKRRIYHRIRMLMKVKAGGRSFWKDAILTISKVLTWFISHRSYAEFLDRISQENNGKGYQYVFECAQGMLQKRKFKKDMFSSIVKVPFEDTFFKAFERSDEYLRNAYGDYMQLPPVENRVTHHYFKAYWKV